MKPFGMPTINDDVLVLDRKTGQRRRFTIVWYNFLDQIAIALSTQIPQFLQADLAKLTAKLTTTDAGLLVWITDFNHILRFDGTAWDFAPGTERSNWYASFDPGGPLPPAGSGWVDTTGGPTVDVLHSDGSISSVTVTAVANAWYRV